MKNIDRIINHPLFIMSMKKIHDYEIDRGILLPWN